MSILQFRISIIDSHHYVDIVFVVVFRMTFFLSLTGHSMCSSNEQCQTTSGI